MATREGIDHQHKLLELHRVTLAHYIKQQAMLGIAYTPPGVIHGIRESRENIKRIKETLCSWNVQVEDQPNDEEEHDFSSELDLPKPSQDQSMLLVELPYVRNVYELYDIISKQDYNYPSTLAIREIIGASKNPSHIVNMSVPIIIDAWSTHKDTVGILTTLLSAQIDFWTPTENLLQKLDSLCIESLDNGDLTQVGVVEPLVYSLASKGMHTGYKDFLRAVVEIQSWRQADIQRITKYYESQGMQLAAFARHLADPHRPGLLRANDVARLLHFASTPIVRSHPRIKARVFQMLAESIDVLHNFGEEELAKMVIEQIGTSQTDTI